MSRSSLVLALAAKDWRLFWADRRAALFCFVVPIVLASAFGMIFHRPSTDRSTSVTKLPVLVVIEDDGAFTDLVAVDLLASPRLDASYATRAEAEAAIAANRPSVAIVLPAGFESSSSGSRDSPTSGRSFAYCIIQLPSPSVTGRKAPSRKC